MMRAPSVEALTVAHRFGVPQLAVGCAVEHEGHARILVLSVRDRAGRFATFRLRASGAKTLIAVAWAALHADTSEDADSDADFSIAGELEVGGP
jgi:hypothetical protein